MKKEIKNNNIAWVDIRKPNEEDLSGLAKKYHFHPLHLEECVTPTYRSGIEEHEEYLFIVFHIPYYSPTLQTTKSVELDIFVTPDTVITVHKKPVPPVDELFNSCQIHDQVREKNFSGEVSYLLYQILTKVLDSYLPKLRHISEHIDEIEDKIFKGWEKEMVEKISLVRRDIIDFGKVIFPQEEIFRRLIQIKGQFFRPYDKKYFYNAYVLYQRARDLLNNNMEMIEALKDTNDSLLTHKLNQLIKVLTIISAIFLPFTFITSLYGMNFGKGLPAWASNIISNPMFFSGLVVFFIVAMLILFLIFKRKRWL